MILKLLEREDAREFVFEEIEQELADWVRSRQMEERYREWMDELKGRYYIERHAWE